MNFKKNNILRKLLNSILIAILLLTNSISANASIIFQDDIFHDIESQGLIINFDESGDENATLQFGDDGTNATITFNDGTGDTTLATPGGAFDFSDDSITTTGAALFNNVSQFRIREDSDPDTNAACGSLGELIYDTTDNQLQRCTVVASPGTWINIDTTGGSTDFEGVYSNDAGNNLTTSNGIFTINTGTNDFVVDSNDWGVDTSGNITTSGTVDGVDVAAIGGQAHAQNTDTGSDTDTFTLNTDNTATDVALKFGGSLAETLTWDTSDTRFVFSDDLRIEGNAAVIGQGYIAGDHAATDSDGYVNIGRNSSAWENLAWDDTGDQFDLSDDLDVDGNITQSGITFTLDADNAGSGADVDIIANQGLDSDGTLRYNATDNQWEFSNDGGVFSAIGSTTGNLSKLFQGIDSTGGMTVTNVAQPIPFDYVSIKDDYYSHSTSVDPSEITILTGGWYRVHAMITVATVSDTAGIRGNPVMHIDVDSGSGFVQQADATGGYIRENATDNLSTSLSGSGLFYFDTNDKIRITAYDTVADEPDEETVAYSSRLVLSYIDRTGSASGSVDNLKDVGDVDANAPSDGQVLTFNDTSSKWEAATPSGGHTQNTDTGTTGISFTLDSDEIGNPDQNIDIIAEQGSESNGTIRYDDGDNEWQLSNNGGAFATISTGSGSSVPTIIQHQDFVSKTTTSTTNDLLDTHTTSTLAIGKYKIDWHHYISNIGDDDKEIGSQVDINVAGGGDVTIGGTSVRGKVIGQVASASGTEFVNMASSGTIVFKLYARCSGGTAQVDRITYIITEVTE